jgi:hypothetical protein
LLKSYNKLWVFGDSFTTPNEYVDIPDSFWALTATKLAIPQVLNYSRPVNSFDTVSQMLVSEQKKFDWKKDLFLIGIPPLERITVFDNFKDTEFCAWDIDTVSWNFEKFDVSSHRGLICLQSLGHDEKLIIHNDRSWTETQTLRDIFLLTKWLDSCNANYVILNLIGREFDKNNVWGPSEFVLEYTKTHPRCVLFENTYHSINFNVNPPVDYDTYGWNGHHGVDGNRHFFEKSLWPKLIDCGLA